MQLIRGLIISRAQIRKVSHRMGHANINTTDSIYTHLFNGDHASDMDKLETLRSTVLLTAVVTRIS